MNNNTNPTINNDNSEEMCSGTTSNTNSTMPAITNDNTAPLNSVSDSDDMNSNNNGTASENTNELPESNDQDSSIDVVVDINENSTSTESNNNDTAEESSRNATLKQHNILENIKNFAVLVWTLITGFASISWTQFGEDWDEIYKTSSLFENVPFSKCIAMSKWKKTLNKIRLNESRDYVLDLMRDPPQISEICETNSHDSIEYRKDVYVNHYFSLFCIYTDDTLQGFLVIGNKDDFNLNSYRGNIELFKDTIDSASKKCDGMDAYYNFISGSTYCRLEMNQYYVECRTQHAIGATPYTLIGYGYCDLSDTVDHRNEPQIPVSIIDYYHDYERFGWPNEKITNLINELKNDDVVKFKENTPVNTFFIFNDNGQLLKDALIDGFSLGISKDTYYNLCDDYMSLIEQETSDRSINAVTGDNS